MLLWRELPAVYEIFAFACARATLVSTILGLRVWIAIVYLFFFPFLDRSIFHVCNVGLVSVDHDGGMHKALPSYAPISDMYHHDFLSDGWFTFSVEKYMIYAFDGSDIVCQSVNNNRNLHSVYTRCSDRRRASSHSYAPGVSEFIAFSIKDKRYSPLWSSDISHHPRLRMQNARKRAIRHESE